MATCVVTGANRGIGLELVKQLHARNDKVIAVCRTPSADLAELASAGVQIEAGIDVGSDASARELTARLDGVAVDLLINNAGVLEIERLDALDTAPITRQFEINAVGPLRVTSALLGTFKAGSKVAMITSRMGSIADNGSGGAYGYRMSKAALNIASVSLARDLKGREIAVGIFHPGMVATDMTKRFGDPAAMQSAKDTAAMLIARIDELSMASSGEFRHANGEKLPW